MARANKTPEDIDRIYEIAARLEELGIPKDTTDRIRKWAAIEAKRIQYKQGSQ